MLLSLEANHNLRRLVTIIIVAALSCFSSVTRGDQYSFATSERDQALLSSQYIWTMAYSYLYKPLAPRSQIESLIKMQTEAINAFRLQHHQPIEYFNQRTIDDTADRLSSNSTTTDTCKIVVSRDGESSLITGEQSMPGDDAPTSFTQYYRGNYGLLYGVQSAITGDSTPVRIPVVWMTTSEAVLNRCPFPSLNIQPELLTLLAGYDPFRMYGANWSASTVDGEMTYTTKVTKGDDAPFTVIMYFDAKHSPVPNSINVKGLDWRDRYNVLSWTHAGQYWMPSVVHFYEAGPLKTMDRTFTLNSVGAASSPLAPTPTEVRYKIVDYRDAGTDMDMMAAVDSKSHYRENTVSYYWPGDFPSMSALRDMFDDQHKDSVQTQSKWLTIGAP